MIAAAAEVAGSNFGGIEADYVVSFILGLAGVSWMVNQGLAAVEKIKRKRGEPGAPLSISEVPDAPTRRELDEIKSRVDRHETELRDIERRILGSIEALGKEIVSRIESVASASYAGRQKIWDRIQGKGGLAEESAKLGTKIDLLREDCAARGGSCGAAAGGISSQRPRRAASSTAASTPGK